MSEEEQMEIDPVEGSSTSLPPKEVTPAVKSQRGEQTKSGYELPW